MLYLLVGCVNLIVVYLICTHFISSTPYTASVEEGFTTTSATKVAASSNEEEEVQELWDLERILSREEICDPNASFCHICRDHVGCCIWSCNLRPNEETRFCLKCQGYGQKDGGWPAKGEKRYDGGDCLKVVLSLDQCEAMIEYSTDDPMEAFNNMSPFIADEQDDNDDDYEERAPQSLDQPEDEAYEEEDDEEERPKKKARGIGSKSTSSKKDGKKKSQE